MWVISSFFKNLYILLKYTIMSFHILLKYTFYVMGLLVPGESKDVGGKYYHGFSWPYGWCHGEKNVFLKRWML